MTNLDIIISSGLFECIEKKDRIKAFETLKISKKKYAKNETIFFAGDLVDKVCLIEKGSVRGEKIYANGELHIVSIFEEGNLFALEIATSRSQASAIDYLSNEETTLLFISMNSIEKSIFAKEFHRTLAHMLADENIKMSHKVEILAERGLRDRILVYFSILQTKAGAPKFQVRMNREQLAQFLCVNRSALSNELNKMKKEGLIDFKGRVFELNRNRPL